MDKMTITLAGSLVFSLFVAAVFALLYKDRLHHYIGKDDKWSFKEWAGPLTTMVASVSLIFTLIHNNPAVTGISIVCGATIILIPPAYQIFSPLKGRAWVFLCFSALTLCAVSTQFLIAAFLSDDDLITGVPAIYLHVFRGLMWVATVFAYLYYVRSTYQALTEQSYLPLAGKPSISQAQEMDTVQGYSPAVAA